MNFFNDDYNDRSKPDLKDPVPERGGKRWLFILSNHFVNLMILNLLFLLCCVPIVTIPASLCALTRTLMILYHTGSCSPWHDFREGFFRSFIGRLFAVFLLCFFPVSLCLWFFAFNLSSFGVGVGVVLVPVCAVSLCYFLAFTARFGADTCDRNVASDVQNAVFSVFRSPRLSLKLLIAPVILYFLGFWYLPYSLLFLVFILFSCGQLALCCILEDLK